MTDVYRDEPLSYDRWVDSFCVDEAEREKLQAQAETLQKSVAFRRVLAELEARAVVVLAECDLGALEEMTKAKATVLALSMIRNHIRAMAEDRFFDDKRKK